MSGQAALGRLVLLLVPAAVAVLLRASVVVVVLLGVVALFVLLVSVFGDWARRDLLARGSGLAEAARVRAEPVPQAPRDLVRLQTLVAARTPTAVGVHQWLRPLLADIAATRLHQAHGVDLHHPDAARWVPQPLWDLVRPDRPEPTDRNAPGLTRAELARLVDQLEAL